MTQRSHKQAKTNKKQSVCWETETGYLSTNVHKDKTKIALSITFNYFILVTVFQFDKN